MAASPHRWSKFEFVLDLYNDIPAAQLEFAGNISVPCLQFVRAHKDEASLHEELTSQAEALA